MTLPGYETEKKQIIDSAQTLGVYVIDLAPRMYKPQRSEFWSVKIRERVITFASRLQDRISNKLIEHVKHNTMKPKEPLYQRQYWTLLKDRYCSFNKLFQDTSRNSFFGTLNKLAPQMYPIDNFT